MDQTSSRIAKVVFFGTPEFAATILESLRQAEDIEVAAVVTQPDRPCGRGRTCKPGAVKRHAANHDLTLFQPESLLAPEATELLSQIGPDFFVVAAYGLILPQRILDIPRFGCLNVHASLLPRHRGASPIQAALLHGDKATGITIMRMVAALDAGPILLQRALAIGMDDTAQSLHDQLASMGGRMIIEAIRGLDQGRLRFIEQDHALATYAPKLTKEQGKIDWARPAYEVHNHIRAMHPWPGAYFLLPTPSGETKKVAVHPGRIGLPLQSAAAGSFLGMEEDHLSIACLDRTYEVFQFHPADAKVMDARAFACGYLRHVLPGTGICAPSPQPVDCDDDTR